MELSRRRLLTALGLTGGSLWLPSATGWRLRAAEPAPPKRLIVLSSNHGCWHPTWQMRPQGVSESEPWAVPLGDLPVDDFSPSLRPLYRHRRRMTVLEGCSLSTAELDAPINRPGDRHATGLTHMWKGSWSGIDGVSGSPDPSIDQLVAAQIARQDRLTSLELMLGENVFLFSGGGLRQTLPPTFDPAEAWQRVFGLTLGDGSTDKDVSVLDFVRKELGLVGSQLSWSDRAKLEQHAQLVRGLERRLVGLSELACDTQPPDPSLSALDLPYDDRWDAMVDVIAAAFSCDVTRVVSFAMGDPSRVSVDGTEGSVHDDFAHWVYEREAASVGMTSVYASHATRVAHLLDVLDQIPEGDGSMMDHTLVLWGSELSDGGHGFRRHPLVMFGGGWAFEAGRYVRWPLGGTPIETWSAEDNSYDDGGLPHQHVLTEVARAMGLEVDHVGLQRVTGQRGHVVELKGGLPAPFR